MSKPPRHNLVTGELWEEDPAAAAAKMVAKLIKSSLKSWDAREAQGIRHQAEQREELVKLYQEMERRGFGPPRAANNDSDGRAQ